MNILGLFLASSLRRNLIERGRSCTLTGVLAIDADGMHAAVRFEKDGVTVTRQEAEPRTRIAGPLSLLVGALVRPRLGTLLRIKVRGSRLFALRALRFFGA